jgi:hypothetical protein
MVVLAGCLVIDGGPGGAAAPDPGVLASIFGWPPVLWTLRLVLLIVILGGAFVLGLVFARFFRREHIRRLWNAPLPQFKEIGGKFAGMEASAKLTAADADLQQQIERMGEQIRSLADSVAALTTPDPIAEESPDGGS